MSKKVNAGVSGICYMGLPPEEGFTYAVYLCPSTGFSFISNKGEKMFSPKSGSEASFVNDVPYADVQQLSPVTVGSCSVCNSPLSSSVSTDELKTWDNVYCPQCGNAINIADLATQGEPVPGQPTGQNDNPPQIDEGAGSPGMPAMEPVACSKDIQTASAESLTMTLHDKDGVNPFWNVIVAGVPAARVALADQDSPEDVKDIFVSEKYPTHVKEAAAKFGVEETLKSINAKLYAYDVSDVAKHVEAKVREELEAQVKAQQMKMRDEFKECVGIVLAGMNKNFFSDIDNPVKASLYQELIKAGVENPVKYIEAAFNESADEFFDVVLAKAVEYMDKPKEVRAEIAQAIGSAGSIPVEQRAATSKDVLGAPQTPAAVKSKLAAGNFIVQADPSAEVTTVKNIDDLKQAYRGVFGRRV